MTRGQYEFLSFMDKGCAYSAGVPRSQCRDNGWVDYADNLTPSGLTALNNMRAAMGSAEYREDLK
jgi:hypothetical protein